MEYIVYIKDDFDATFRKNQVYYWNSITGFKYIETSGTIVYLKNMYKSFYGEDMKELNSTAAGPQHARLYEINKTVE